MNKTEDIICAYDVSNTGVAKSLNWNDLSLEPPQDCWRWAHFNRMAAKVDQWLEESSGLSEAVLKPLLADETRPRVQLIGEGHLINLRGVNLNPGSSPEDMVSVRLWIEGQRIVSLRKFKLLAVQDIRDTLELGKGPTSIGDFVCRLVAGLIDRMSVVVIDLDDVLDELEAEIIDLPTNSQRERLSLARRQAIALKRFLSPQRDAVAKLANLQVAWLGAEQIASVRESLDQTTRLIEALDSIRERAGLLHEEFVGALAEKNNRNSYVLAIVAAIFLPLSFFTGLLGINVGGIPGADEPFAFIGVTILIVAIGILELLLFRYLKWI